MYERRMTCLKIRKNMGISPLSPKKNQVDLLCYPYSIFFPTFINFASNFVNYSFISIREIEKVKKI